MTNRIPLLLLLVCALPLVRVAAQDQPPGSTAPADEGTNAPVKDLGNGQLQIGKVIVNPRERTVTFPTLVNMNNGLVEYFLVSDH